MIPATRRSSEMSARQRGFTLLETAIVIGILIAASIAAVKLGGDLLLRSRARAEVQDVETLVANVTRLYSAYPPPAPYASLTGAAAARRSLIPTALDRGGGVIVGRWGAITLAPGNLSGGNPGTAMQVTLANIPQAVCAIMAPALLGATDELDVGGGNNLKSAANPNPAPDTVAAACGRAGGPAVAIRIRKS